MNDSCEMAEFSTHSEPVARKKHQCCECRAPIEKGEKHFLLTGKWDFGMDSFRQHFACMEACMLIRDNDSIYGGGECIPFGGLKDHVWEFRLDIKDAAQRGNEAAKRLRHLLAVIKWRERGSGKKGIKP